MLEQAPAGPRGSKAGHLPGLQGFQENESAQSPVTAMQTNSNSRRNPGWADAVGPTVC